jgi:hypothetical protein
VSTVALLSEFEVFALLSLFGIELALPISICKDYSREPRLHILHRRFFAVTLAT